MMDAASDGHLEVAKRLVAQPGVDMNQTTEDGRTILMVAASSGHLEMVKFLVAQPGVDTSRTSKGGLTALAFAAIRGNLDVVRYLVAQPDADVKEGRRVLGDLSAGEASRVVPEVDAAVRRPFKSPLTRSNRPRRLLGHGRRWSTVVF